MHCSAYASSETFNLLIECRYRRRVVENSNHATSNQLEFSTPERKLASSEITETLTIVVTPTSSKQKLHPSVKTNETRVSKKIRVKSQSNTISPELR